MEGQNIEAKIDAIILKRWHIVAGVLGFVVTFIYPVVFFGMRLDKNQALIEQSIQTIQLNHEQHLQGAIEEIKDIKFEQSDLLKKIDVDHEAIIRLLQMHEL